MTRPRVSVGARLMLLMAGLAGASTGLALVLQDRALSRDLEEAASARLEQAATGSRRLLADHLRSRADHYAAVARTPEFRANLETGHRDTIRFHAEELLRRERAAAVVFAGPRGDDVAAAGDAELTVTLAAGFDAESGASPRPCARVDDERAEPSTGDFVPCVPDASVPQATLVRMGGATYTATAIPLITNGHRVGLLRAAERLDPAVLAAWSQLTGARLRLAQPGVAAQAALVQRVLRFPDLDLEAVYSMERERAILAHARRGLVGVGAVTLALALTASALLARGFVRPIREIRRVTERVGRGELDARLDIRRNDEIGDVASAFNATLGRLHESHERVGVAQRLARFGDWGIDPETGLLEGSAQFWQILELEAAGGKTLEDLLERILPEDRPALSRAVERCRDPGRAFRLEVQTADAGSARRVLLIQAQRVSDGGRPPCVEASVQDVTEQRAVEDQIRYLAYHDSLTGLGNRRFFEEHLTLALADARRRLESLAVLFLDLDRFKAINDTLGHAAGDSLLQEVASRLVRQLKPAGRDVEGPGPVVARLGGDEFMALLPAPTDADQAEFVGHEILRRLSEPITIEDNVLEITGSIGIAFWPDDGSDVEELLRSSDTAMYYAKAQGPNQLQFCADSLRESRARRSQVEMRLRQALERNDLEVHYQPRVEAANGRIVGFEALLRWCDPELGAVSPDDFVPIAEDAGLIRSLGRWVLQHAATQAKDWREAGFRDLGISVNLSPLQLHPDFLRTFDQVLEETGLEANCLELEVTETAIMEQPTQAVEVLAALRERGARIALDDFGTGYSSFSKLRQLPIDALKIDRSFVQPMADDEDAAAVVAAMVSMAHVLRLRVVVEGVEDTAQHELLREMGCEELQGFLFGQPTPAREAGERLTRRARRKRKRSVRS